MAEAATVVVGRRARLMAMVTRVARIAGLVLLVLSAGLAAEVVALLLLSL